MRLVLCGCLLMALVGCGAKSPDTVTELPESETNRLLALILAGPREDGRFAVVWPTTTLSGAESHTVSEVRQMKKYIKDEFADAGYKIGSLLDRLFEANRRPVRLTLESSRSAGYVVDYDSTYAAYFDETGARGGWAVLREEHPEVLCTTQVSLPVLDRNTGHVLVYLGSSFGFLAGSGHMVLYEYKAGRLKLLARVMTWIS